MQKQPTVIETGQRLRKALCVHVGEAVGNELVDLIDALIRRVEELERTKVDVMPIVPGGKSPGGRRSPNLSAR